MKLRFTRKHDNEQLASALMNSLPVEIAELLRLTHGTTATGGTQLVSGFTILDYVGIANS